MIDDTTRMLEEGARRSREACSLPEELPLHLRIWSKHRWLIIGALIFLLIDLVLMAGLGSTMGTHF